MDNPQPTQSSQSLLDTLRTVEFRLGLKGYNVDEVDEYLEKAAVEAESVQEQLRQANDRVRQSQTRTAQLEEELRQTGTEIPSTTVAVPAIEAPMSDDTLQRTLVLAQKFVDQVKRDSETEAHDVVAKAEERARTILGQAEERSRQMATEAEHRLREDVTRLEGMRTQLSADVEKMARHLETERNRLRSSIGEMLKWLDENVQPASGLTSVRPRTSEPGSTNGTSGTNGTSDEGRRAAAS
ncbi:MAG: DivIVA domain-containing protein [Acidimicrobiales bacterium]